MLFKNICVRLVGISLLFVAANNTFAADRPHITEDTTFVPKEKKHFRGDRKLATEPTQTSNNFVLHNNSSFDIYCRCRSNEEAEANLYVTCVDRIIKAGDSFTFPMDRNYSIKTAGTSSLAPYSYFYNVPKPDVLTIEKYLTNEELRRYNRDFRTFANPLPIVHVTSGITHGWNFTIGLIDQQN